MLITRDCVDLPMIISGRKLTSIVKAMLVLFFVLFYAIGVNAASVVVISKDASLYQQVSNSIRQSYTGELRSITLNDAKATPSLISPSTDIMISVGVEATDFLMRQMPTSNRLLAVLIPESAYRTLRNLHKERWRGAEDHISAIFMDQPLARQLRLAKLVVPDLHRIGTALGPSTRKQLPGLKLAAKQEGVELVHAVVNSNDNPVKRLQPVIQHSDVFVPVPDSAVFNRTTAKWILYIAYRKRIPLIGFSRKYVEAGAVAAVHSTPAQLGQQAGEWLDRYNKDSHRLPKPQFPQYFSVSVNRVAARSLQMTLPENDVLVRQLQEAEQ